MYVLGIIQSVEFYIIYIFLSCSAWWLPQPTKEEVTLLGFLLERQSLAFLLLVDPSSPKDVTHMPLTSRLKLTTYLMTAEAGDTQTTIITYCAYK